MSKPSTALESSARSILDDLERAWKETKLIREAARRSGNVGQALSAIRTALSVLELQARITGELDYRPRVTVNLVETREWLQVRVIVLAFVEETLGEKQRNELDRRLRVVEGAA